MTIDWVWLGVQFLVVIVLSGTMIVDFYFQEVPVRAVAIAMAVILAVLLFREYAGITTSSRITGAAAGAGFFLWQYILSRGRWVGGGDIWIGAFLGLVFGWHSVVIVVAAGYGLAATASLVYVALFRSKISRPVPLGGFLCLSALFFFLSNVL